MSTAGEEVYLGREGTGAANIIGSPVNVWGQVFARQRQRDVDAIAQRRMDLELAKFKDKQVKEWEERDFSKGWKMYDEQIANETNAYRETFRELLNQGLDPRQASQYTEDFRADIERKLGRSRKAEEQFRVLQNEIKNPLLDQTWAKQYLNDTHLQADIDQADLERGANVLNHPRVINPSAVIQDAIKPIADQIGTTIFNPDEIQSSGLGKYAVVTDRVLRFDPAKKEELVDFIIDKSQMGGINIYDRLLWEYIAETRNLDQRLDAPVIDRMYEEMKSNPPIEADTYVRQRIKDELDQYQKVKERGKIVRFGQFSSGSGGRKNLTTEDLENRDYSITMLQNPVDENGNINVDSQNLIESLRNVKISGMPVEDVELVLAGGKSELDGASKPYDRYVFRLRSGTSFGTATFTNKEIDLSKTNEAFWNNLLNSMPGAKKIDFGDLTGKELKERKKSKGALDNLGLD